MTVEQLMAGPEPNDVNPAALFAEQRFLLTADVAASSEKIDDPYLRKIAGELAMRLSTPDSDLNTDREKLAGLMCLAGHIYDVLHPELFEDEPDVILGQGERQFVTNSYGGVKDKATFFIYRLNSYLDSDMTRFRRVRDKIGFLDDEEAGILPGTVAEQR